MRIAGIKVGAVTSVDAGRCQRHATSRSASGSRTPSSATRPQAIIKIKTLLGRKYLALDSAGEHQQKPGPTIPLSRTLTPYDVYPAFPS